MLINYAQLKRIIDFLSALLGIIVVGPIILFSALVVWIEDRSASPFLKQERIGMGEQPFILLKLRTMRSERFRDDRKLTDSERMLRTGRLFRKFSVDELPQLVNLIRGQMSLIGPRPMPIVYLPYFTPEERARHLVRPGMSGLAQVNGRNFLTWEQKFAFDVKYVENICLRLDIVIFIQTLSRLALPSDVGIRGETLSTRSLHEERKPWPAQGGAENQG
jgi:undecaprenyl phosphate N,N'-diacetylbacillosamine 1-phosphate transferase